MSHVVDSKVVIQDLDALDAACQANGRIELVRNVKTYKWWGRHVGDYPLPAGFTKADLGHCDHVIRVKGADARTYEVGVVRRKDGEGYTFLYDFISGGYGLLDALSGQPYRTGGRPEEALQSLMQEYTLQAAERAPDVQAMLAAGWLTQRETQPNGDVQLVIYKQ